MAQSKRLDYFSLEDAPHLTPAALQHFLDQEADLEDDSEG